VSAEQAADSRRLNTLNCVQGWVEQWENWLGDTWLHALEHDFTAVA